MPIGFALINPMLELPTDTPNRPPVWPHAAMLPGEAFAAWREAAAPEAVSKAATAQATLKNLTGPIHPPPRGKEEGVKTHARS